MWSVMFNSHPSLLQQRRCFPLSITSKSACLVARISLPDERRMLRALNDALEEVAGKHDVLILQIAQIARSVSLLPMTTASGLSPQSTIKNPVVFGMNRAWYL